MTRRLKDNVSVDGCLYRRGQSDADVGNAAMRIGDHAWEEVESGASAPPPPAPSTFSARVEAPSPFQAPQQRQAPAVESVDDEPAAGQGDVSPAPSVDLPPLSGPGSSGAAWRAYAGSLGVEVPGDAKRDDVIDAIRAAGKPVE